MTSSHIQVLIVHGRSEMAAALSGHIMTNLDADVTVVDTIEGARAMAASTAFDLFVAGERLPDGDGLSLLDEKDNWSGTPLVLVDDQLDGQRTLAALRRGALDVLTPPIELDRLLAVIRRAVKGEQSRQRREARAKRLRRLSSRLISDRRELRQRVDLICRDLVEAYRRLAEKVTASDDEQHLRKPPRPIDSFTSEA